MYLLLTKKKKRIAVFQSQIKRIAKLNFFLIQREMTIIITHFSFLFASKRAVQKLFYDIRGEGGLGGDFSVKYLGKMAHREWLYLDKS